MRMKVYELIQRLVEFDADADVEINIVLDKKECEGKIADVPEDLETGDPVDVEISLDEDADDFDIDSRIKYVTGIAREYCQISANLR